VNSTNYQPDTSPIVEASTLAPVRWDEIGKGSPNTIGRQRRVPADQPMSPDAPIFRWVPPGELHLHPTLERYGIAATTAERNKVVQGNHIVLREPVDVTTDGTILDGDLQWKAALNDGRKLILCVKHSLTDYEQVAWLLWRHRRRNGWNNYCRILIALEFESKFKKAALDNQIAGGRTKGLSSLTKAEEMHVRSKLAELADVCEAYIDYVKQLRGGADVEILQALESGEISISWAWNVLRFSKSEQRNILENRRAEKAVRLAYSRPRKRTFPLNPAQLREVWQQFVADYAGPIRCSVIPIGSKRVEFRVQVDEALLTRIQSQGELYL
jgi:hypothetical protein